MNDELTLHMNWVKQHAINLRASLPAVVYGFETTGFGLNSNKDVVTAFVAFTVDKDGTVSVPTGIKLDWRNDVSAEKFADLKERYNKTLAAMNGRTMIVPSLEAPGEDAVPAKEAAHRIVNYLANMQEQGYMLASYNSTGFGNPALLSLMQSPERPDFPGVIVNLDEIYDMGLVEKAAAMHAVPAQTDQARIHFFSEIAASRKPAWALESTAMPRYSIVHDVPEHERSAVSFVKAAASVLKKQLLD